MFTDVYIYICMNTKHTEVDWFLLCCPPKCDGPPQAPAPGRKLVATGDWGMADGMTCGIFHEERHPPSIPPGKTKPRGSSCYVRGG